MSKQPIHNLSMQRTLEARHDRSLRIIALYSKGMKIRDICDMFECSRNTVLRLARQAGLKKRPKSFDPEIRNNCLIMLRANKKLAEISEAWGVSQAYVSGLAKENGLSRYKTQKQSP